MKIAVNKCYGSFGVNEAVFNELGIEWDGYGELHNEDFGIERNYKLAYRNHPRLIAAIEKVGEKGASGQWAKIQITDIPDNIDWEIKSYNGYEIVAEKHRSW